MQFPISGGSEELQKIYLKSRRLKSFKRGERIYQAAEKCGGICVLEKGLVGLVYHSAKGSDHLLRLFKAGQFFGHRSYFAEEDHHATALALEQCEVGFLDRELFEGILASEPGLIRIILKTTAKELRRAEIHRVIVSEEDVLARTAHALLVLKEMDPKHSWTRSEIANFCASTSPSIVRALTRLEDEGLIQQKGREILILRPEELAQIGQEP